MPEKTGLIEEKEIKEGKMNWKQKNELKRQDTN